MLPTGISPERNLSVGGAVRVTGLIAPTETGQGLLAWRALLRLLAALCAGAPASVQAQVDTLVVHGACANCEIDLELIAVLGGSDLPFELGMVSNVAVMASGHFLVAPTLNPGEIAVFDQHGKFERVIGREGDGPGEYRRIRTIVVGPADTIRVLEWASFSTLAPDFSFLRRTFFDRLVDAWTVLPTGGLAVLSTSLGTGSPPNRLHILGPDGRLESSFAAAPRSYDRRRDVNERFGALAPSGRLGGIWFAKSNRYAVELYVAQELRKVIMRQVDWFQPWEGYLPLEGFASPPRPAIEAIAELRDGSLLVLARRADSMWERNRVAFARAAGPESFRPRDIDRNLMFDSVVELIDPTTGAVIGIARSADYIRGPIGDGSIVFTRRADGIGRVRIFVYRLVTPGHTSR